jgi:hypothetical protein
VSPSFFFSRYSHISLCLLSRPSLLSYLCFSSLCFEFEKDNMLQQLSPSDRVFEHFFEPGYLTPKCGNTSKVSLQALSPDNSMHSW